VPGRFFAIVVQEGSQRVARSFGRVAGRRRSAAGGTVTHAQGELAQLVLAGGQPMRLEVEKELQAMLGLAQETIAGFEKVVFLARQAPDLLQRLHGQQRIALANRRQVAAVEELQEMDGEFDVADAAVTGFDLGVADAGPAGLVLDAPLDRLDLVDFGETQILAVDEGLDGAQELLAELLVPGDGPNLDERLALPRAPEGIVVRKG